MRILLAEDDQLLGEGLSTGLRQDGYAVDWEKDGIQVESALKAESFDLLILDLGLPRRDGVDVLKRLRADGNSIPVLVLTARDAISDRVTGLDSGADDYMVKPCDLDELNARIRALVRRSKGRAQTLLRFSDIELDPAGFEVRQQGEHVDLSPREFSLLQTLMESSGRVVRRERLVQSLYSWDEEVESNTLEVHIHHLRKKLGAECIKTVRGVGYQLSKVAK
jgi:two-component system OmpR family response regulator/two-component system response regulator QseB